MGVRAATILRLGRPVGGAVPAPFLFSYGRILSFHHAIPEPMNPGNRELYNHTFAKIIGYLKKHQSLEIVEADLFVGISYRNDYRAVDVLVNSATYLDDGSFRIDYSYPKYNRNEQFRRGDRSEMGMNTTRVPDSADSVVIRPYSDTTDLLVTPRDLVALLNAVKATVGFRERQPDACFEHYAKPLRALSYDEIIDAERRVRMFDRYYVQGIQAIIQYLDKRESFDLSWMGLFVYVFDRKISEIADDRTLDAADCSYVARVERIIRRDEDSFLLDVGPHSVVVHHDRLHAPNLLPLDILRLRLAVECIMRAERRAPLSVYDFDTDEIDWLVKHESLQREVVEDIIDIGYRVERRYSARKISR